MPRACCSFVAVVVAVAKPVGDVAYDAKAVAKFEAETDDCVANTAD